MTIKLSQCGNYSDGVFWDIQLTWNTTDPDFPECFHKTVLIWIPCAVLWLFLPAEIYCFRYIRGNLIPWSKLNIAKLLLNGILFSLCMMSLGKVVRNGENNDSILIDVVGPGIQGFSYMLSFLLVAIERKKGLQSSGLFFFFWFVSVICCAFTWSHLFRKNYESLSYSQKFDFVIFQISYLLVIIQFFLSCFNDSRPFNVLIEDVDEAACPRNTASFLSKLLFTWYDKLLWKGFRTKLKSSDIWRSAPEVLSKNSYHELLKHWTNRARSNVRPSLTKAIADMHLSSYCFIWTMKFALDILIYTNPFILSFLIEFTSNDEPVWHGILYAALMLLSTLCVSLLDWNADYHSSVIGYSVQSALMSMIYRKSLTIASACKRTSTSGEVINLLSVDVSHITNFVSEMIHVLTLPLQIGVGIAMLYYFLGVAAFAGFVAMILLKLFSGYLAKKMESLEGRHLELKDERVKQINEAVLGVKLLKLFAWEHPFINRIQNSRLKEIYNLKIGLRYESLGVAVWSIAPAIVTLITLFTYVLMDDKNVLDASKIFVTLNIVAILQIPMIRLPIILVFFVQARVSIQRLNEYLNKKDIDTSYVTHDAKDGNVIAVEDGTFSWGLEGEEENNGMILKNINLSVTNGSLVAIVGTVGCGKSSLLSGILGEMEKISGSVHTKGNIAYVPQQAWVQNATLKENILFGKPINEGFYSKVVTACGLVPDLAILPGGDATEIGENGINLSGGQKQRVSLARAVFSDADIYLLDDPLSAVDAHVGQHIFENVIGHSGVLRKKTRVLVTHGITYLPYMDQIVVLSNGKVSEVGTYEQLISREGDFAEFIATYGLVNNSEPSSKYQRSQSTRSRADTECEDNVHGDETAVGSTLTYAENKEHREATLSIYALYLKYIGCPFVIAICILMVLQQACYAGIQNWLSFWSVDSLLPDGSQDIQLRNIRMSVYGGLTILFGVLVVSNFNVLMAGARRAAIGFHSNMLLSVFRSPMSFFDTTPSGRIINRFSEDIEAVDFQLPISFRDFMSTLLEIVGAIFVMCIRVPLIIGIILPISIGYGFLQCFFVKTVNQLRRLETVSKSPVFSRFSETLMGCMTIRAFGLQRSFIKQFDARIDENVKFEFYRRILFWWIGLRLDLIGGVMVFCISLVIVTLKESLDPGLVGLVITYAITVNYMFAWLVYNAGELETYVVSVERIHEYISLPSEAQWEIPQNKPESNWPQNGQVIFKNYATRYRDELENILHHVSLNVAACEKIGVVGRTGAGKSSVTMSLFRIIEATEGTIEIDGVDISKIGLHDLRTNLTIIPQDPVLFSGTLRLNLDPFEQYSDDEVWRALEFSHLKDHVSSLSGGLLHFVAEGGTNLSVGQKQLVCLARALLRKTKILILDEATAAVDLETDDLIQATIRKEFADCTVFTIAHRINTIMDSTRIILLDAGKVKEFDTPQNLLADSTSMFYSMAKDAGLV